MAMARITDGTKKALFAAALFFCCASLVGWADSWEDIQRESTKITSLSARFTQSKHMKILAKPLISQGRFYFQAPDSVRWEYTVPVRSVLLMSRSGIKRFTQAQGGRGFVEEAGGSVQSMQIVLQEISQWSKGRFTANENFSAVLKGGKEPKIILTPKEKGLAAMISKIVITLSAEGPGQMRSVKIFENEGNYTLFEFSDVQKNVKLGEKLFREAE